MVDSSVPRLLSTAGLELMRQCGQGESILKMDPLTTPIFSPNLASPEITGDLSSSHYILRDVWLSTSRPVAALNLLPSPLDMAVTLAQENGMQASIKSIITFRWELEEGWWVCFGMEDFSFLCRQGNLKGSFPSLGTLMRERWASSPKKFIWSMSKNTPCCCKFLFYLFWPRNLVHSGNLEVKRKLPCLVFHMIYYGFGFNPQFSLSSLYLLFLMVLCLLPLSTAMKANIIWEERWRKSEVGTGLTCRSMSESSRSHLTSKDSSCDILISCGIPSIYGKFPYL